MGEYFIDGPFAVHFIHAIELGVHSTGEKPVIVRYMNLL